MCLRSKTPAPVCTVGSWSGNDEYGGGRAQPPKSTIRPPRATCSAWRAVRSVAAKLALAQQVGDLFGLDVEQQLLVVPAAGVDDDGADVLGPLRRPLQPLSDLRHGRSPVQLAGEEELDPVVIRGRLEQQPLLAHRGLLGAEGILHCERRLRSPVA